MQLYLASTQAWYYGTWIICKLIPSNEYLNPTEDKFREKGKDNIGLCISSTSTEYTLVAGITSGTL